MLGGMFSGLCHVSGDPENVFYAAADRGPNEEVMVGKEQRRTFPVSEYGPLIYKLRADHGRLHVISQIGIRTRRGRPVTGLPNTDADEPPYTSDGKRRLALDPNGLDVEGLAVAPDGSFWIADEYRPSVAHVAANGTVLARLIPEGSVLSADTDVRAVLPRLYARRQLNRGFEGVALSPDGSLLFASLESPLANPNREVARKSRMVRLLVLDVGRLQPLAEYLYVTERAADFGETHQGEMRISDLACLGRSMLLASERAQTRSRIYRVDLSRATNLFGTRWSSRERQAESLETLTPEELGQYGIVPARKSLLVDLGGLPGVPKKIEGLTIVNPTTLAVGNDNDFAFSGFDRRGRAIRKEAPCILTLVRLPQPLPLARSARR